MKKLLSLAVLALLVVSCGNNAKDYVTIAGKIQHPNTDSIFLMKDGMRRAIFVDKGEFRDTLKTNKAGYYNLVIDREQTPIFLNPGDSLYLTANMKQFESSLSFGGDATGENVYLADKIIREMEIYLRPDQIFSLPADEFLARVNQLKNELNQKLEQTETSSIFQEWEAKNNEYGKYILMAQYPSAHTYFTQRETEMPEIFKIDLDKLDLSNDEDFTNIPNYVQYVMVNSLDKMTKAETAKEMTDIVLENKSEKVRDRLMGLLVNKIEGADAEADQLNQFIQENSNDSEMKTKAQTAYDKVKNLLAGKPSPKFEYPDMAGKNVSLDDLKGNLVYIDVWATWCMPCIREIPAMTQLEADYRNKNVKFVGISVDPKRDYDKWQNMVREKDMKGLQLFSDKDWKSQFIQDYGITAIPRFLLLDENGNIITADAPRPSDPTIRKLLDEKLKG